MFPRRGRDWGWGGGVLGGGWRVGPEAKPRRPVGEQSWRARRARRRSPLFGDFVVVSRGGGRTLTGESFDGLHRPVLVGAVHEGITGLDQELAAVGDLVLCKHFLQVGGGHALVEIADVKLVHGGGLRAGRGPWQGRASGRARAASLLGRDADGQAAGGGSRKLSLHPTPEVVRSPGRGGRPEGAQRSQRSSGRPRRSARGALGG